jgi:tetratricopeptide (TPR) repeat protein
MADSANTRDHRKIKLYLTLATLFMAFAGLFSSLSGSFLLFGLAVACVFYWLAYSAHRRLEPQTSYRSSQQYQNQTKATHTAATATADSRKVVMIASLFIGGVFFLIIILSIAFSDSEDTFYLKARGDNAFAEGQYDSAKYFYQRVLKEDASDIETMLAYGNALLETKDYDSANYYYDKVLDADPANLYARYNKGLINYRQQNYPEAIEESRKALDVDPAYYDADYLIGDSYYALQNNDSAYYYYDVAYHGGIRTAWICHVLGYLKDVKGNTDDAIALYKESLTYDDSKTEIYQRLGELIPGEEGEEYRRRATAK